MKELKRLQAEFSFSTCVVKGLPERVIEKLADLCFQFILIINCKITCLYWFITFTVSIYKISKF